MGGHKLPLQRRRRHKSNTRPRLRRNRTTTNPTKSSNSTNNQLPLLPPSQTKKYLAPQFIEGFPPHIQKYFAPQFTEMYSYLHYPNPFRARLHPVSHSYRLPNFALSLFASDVSCFARNLFLSWITLWLHSRSEAF